MPRKPQQASPPRTGAPLRDPDLGKRRSLTVRVRPDLDDALRDYAATRGVRLSVAIDAAIAALVGAHHG